MKAIHYSFFGPLDCPSPSAERPLSLCICPPKLKSQKSEIGFLAKDSKRGPLRSSCVMALIKTSRCVAGTSIMTLLKRFMYALNVHFSSCFTLKTLGGWEGNTTTWGGRGTGGAS
ncbi:UNVERIFIED_CONTAM: hypothetical protein Sradi_4027500 [Sesamum radiatum]|uniref:Uncharacterized protein n=1 Tax=Sesamum radiatum TaxID=300843 RepID=A0AAW2PN33_SESRA